MARGGWSDIDQEADPGRCVLGLDRVHDDPFFGGLARRLVILADVSPGKIVLDVGCGTGEDVAGFQQAGGVAIGADLSAWMLVTARERHASVPLMAADCRALPVMAESVDVVFANRVLQHLERPGDALSEWRRVLRPGGRVVVCDPDLTSAQVEGLDADRAAAVLAWRSSSRPGRDAVANLRRYLRTAGFREVRDEVHRLDVGDLTRVDGIFGLATSGELAARAKVLDDASARRWSSDVHLAWRDGRLRYTCQYVVAVARAS